MHIKTGEEKKQKVYRALCIVKNPANFEMMKKLDIPNGFLLQQMTPLRVLHRRPFLTRPRQIYSVKAYVYQGESSNRPSYITLFLFVNKFVSFPANTRMLILDVVTQAGTYVKELVHGEFGRTQPSISSIIGEDIDIVALDVNAIDLDWPKEIDNKASLAETTET